ncbi:CMP-N-acetylneuraminate-beta-1,4-galactoside alpha-2,3-sialyltransferase-like [Esox lucius]|uniref:CMP-N-acetylneuraminate-beta-1,4-galactoside alpha-2,3-sialyltransferase-like n=1 Tax=Esox lucius TaxID=8010 RepID=UPI001476D53E|nr:CMP-N-acetylneuraminate-beta-1,4-galactoside alpha-2,3-sialyltransferase-like [Esox lucius]
MPFQNIPTLGTVAITMALHNCDEVAVAGFGYDMTAPHAPLHYYDKIMMAAINEVMQTEPTVQMRGSLAEACTSSYPN